MNSKSYTINLRATRKLGGFEKKGSFFYYSVDYPKNFKKGFTLIELLGVIAILMIFGAFTMPMIQQAIQKAKHSACANSLQQITLAYIQAHADGTLPTSDNIHEWVAEFSLQKDLDDPKLWIFGSDQQNLCEKLPRYMCTTSTQKGIALNPEFAALPLSIAIVKNVSDSAKPSRTPILWSRGLSKDGSWSLLKGTFGCKGGFIGFLDGHVEWFNALVLENTPFLSLKTGEPTVNVLEALPENVAILQTQ